MPKSRVLSMLQSNPVFILPGVNSLDFLFVINFKKLIYVPNSTLKNVALVYKLTCHQEVKATTATGCWRHRQRAQQHRHTALPKVVTDRTTVFMGIPLSWWQGRVLWVCGLPLYPPTALDGRKQRDGWYKSPKPSPKMQCGCVFLWAQALAPQWSRPLAS